MLCENCKQNEATVYMSEVVNGQMTEHYFCDECVKKSQEELGSKAILFNNFISELMKIALKDGYVKSPATSVQKVCPSCGLSLKEFLEIGRFGCESCFSTFNDELKNAFTNVHGNTKHVGKMIVADIPESEPQKAAAEKTDDKVQVLSKEDEIIKLETALHKAVKAEEYEEAARLRDTIRALKKEGTD